MGPRAFLAPRGEVGLHYHQLESRYDHNQRHVLRSDEELPNQDGHYSYRGITTLLQRAGWQVRKDRPTSPFR